MKLPLIPQDKANHAIYGALIFFVLQFFVAPIIALFAVAIVAFLKEVYDRVTHSGNSEVLDFLVTIAGAIPLFLLSC